MKKKKEKNEKKEANNEPKRAINEMQTETRERKKKRNSIHVADSVTVSMSGVFSLSFVSATVLHSGHTGLAITH